MGNIQSHKSDRSMIVAVIQRYIDSAKSGKSYDMASAFHKDATVFGYIDDKLFAGPIERFFSWHDKNGAAAELQTDIVSIDLIETIATVRLELNNWTGFIFVDLFTLLKIDNQWKIMNKVFHIHI